MADALVSVPVAVTAGVAAAALIVIASRKVSKSPRQDLVPLMGVMGAFVFAAQMINFTIPGTGSSGHIIGGVLLASLMGPWAAFITLASVLIIQCFVFADGGMMALGCNLINMGAVSCLLAYPFIYRPIVGGSLKKMKIMVGSILACVIGLEIGALLVTVETELSGITALPWGEFLGFMLPIHVAIGICEGVATGALICFVAAYKPDMLYQPSRVKEQAESYATSREKMSQRTKVVLYTFGAIALVFAVAFTWIASSNPDGLEWSIANVTGAEELGEAMIPATAFMPDYDSTFSGIVGGVIVVVLLWAFCSILFRHRKTKAVAKN